MTVVIGWLLCFALWTAWRSWVAANALLRGHEPPKSAPIMRTAGVMLIAGVGGFALRTTDLGGFRPVSDEEAAKQLGA